MTTSACANRIRSLLADSGMDAVVLTHPHDVRYATGYHSILERWGQMEPYAGAIVFADPAKPVILAIPEAGLGIVATLNAEAERCVFDELRVFDMLNFCEVGRYVDPHAVPGALEDVTGRIAARYRRGPCAPDIVAALAAALADHGMSGARIGFDDLRLSGAIARDLTHVPSDALDFMMRVRVVKTPEEIARYREVGAMADRVIRHAGSCLEIGKDWTDVQGDIASFMIRNGVTPVDEGAMLFGGEFGGDFMPALFRTKSRRPLQSGDLVILETQGTYDGFWIDINRTAVIGKPSAAYQALHDILRDAFLMMVDALRPGVMTNTLPPIGYDHIKSKGVSAPEKLLVVAHGIGLMPLEIPIPFPAAGLAGVKQGFRIEEDMLISLDSLFFGAELGPCHMENVYAITATGVEPMYHTPLELIVADRVKPAPGRT